MSESENEASRSHLESTIRQNLELVRQKIAGANPENRPVRIVAVTKMFGPEVARAAYECGLTELGENYAQHLHEKASELDNSSIRWHFIGGLQTNKIKRYGRHVAVWQTMDRAKLVTELAKRFPGAEMMVQVNTTGEAQKSGCEPGQVPELVDLARGLGLTVSGLMTVGPTDTSQDPRPSFVALRSLAEANELIELSMGMSGDYPLAIAEGATMIRVGSVLFGQRSKSG